VTEPERGTARWTEEAASVKYRDGRRRFAVRDDTFLEAGKVGVWSKAGSVTVFERFQQGDKS
jgi:hypothetical protein